MPVASVAYALATATPRRALLVSAAQLFNTTGFSQSGPTRVGHQDVDSADCKCGT
jgi:hypothetical protein